LNIVKNYNYLPWTARSKEFTLPYLRSLMNSVFVLIEIAAYDEGMPKMRKNTYYPKSNSVPKCR